MSLQLLKTALQTAEARALHRRMSLEAWSEDAEMRAAKVALFREYADGDHRADLSDEMAKMLRVSKKDSSRFNDNYMDIVIQTEADRLKLTGLDTDTDAGTEWITSVMEANRIDALQSDVHEAALRDSETYVMAWWDDTQGRVVWTHEPAYDGTNGMLVVEGPDNSIQAALKVWLESHESFGDTTRINVYYADRVQRYISNNGGSLMPYETDTAPAVQMLLYKGEALGVPVVHFPNRGGSHTFHGLSEIENAIPLQDALNRTLYSMVMTSELTGFGIRYSIGLAEKPANFQPGSWINVPAADKDDRVEFGMLEQGTITPFIEQARWLTSEIGKITRTPAPEFMGGDNASGEALRQREIGLLGKVGRFQTKAGNRWEDLARLSWRIEASIGGRTPPPFTTISAKWQRAELRNDAEVVANSKVLAEMGLIEESLRQMASVFNWDNDKVQSLVDEYNARQASNLGAIMGNLNAPTFDDALATVTL